MPGMTNRAVKLMVGSFFADDGTPTSFKMALCTAAVTPTADTNLLSDLTEIAVGNGYSAGGVTVARNLTTGFDTLTEDDSGNTGYIRVQDVSFLASGGTLPASGDGASWAVLTDDSGNVMGYFTLTSPQSVADGQSININSAELRLEND